MSKSKSDVATGYAGALLMKLRPQRVLSASYVTIVIHKVVKIFNLSRRQFSLSTLNKRLDLLGIEK